MHFHVQLILFITMESAGFGPKTFHLEAEAATTEPQRFVDLAAIKQPFKAFWRYLVIAGNIGCIIIAYNIQKMKTNILVRYLIKSIFLFLFYVDINNFRLSTVKNKPNEAELNMYSFIKHVVKEIDR